MSAICDPFQALEALSGYLSSFIAERHKGKNFESSICDSKILKNYEEQYIIPREFGNALHKVLPALTPVDPVVIFSEELNTKLATPSDIGANLKLRLNLFELRKLPSATEKLDQFEKLLEPNTDQTEICRLNFLKGLFNTLDRIISFKRIAAFDLESHTNDQLIGLVSDLVVQFNAIQERLNELIELSLLAIGNKLLGEEVDGKLLKRFETIIAEKLINPLINKTDITKRAFMNLHADRFGCGA